MGSEKPWWFPVKIDGAYFRRLRDDYPDKAHWTDDQLNEYFNKRGGKYAVTWDHVGEAYEEYEQLADAYFKLLKEKDND